MTNALPAFLIAVSAARAVAAAGMFGTWAGTWQTGGRTDQVCLSLSQDAGALRANLAYDDDSKYATIASPLAADNSVTFDIGDADRESIHLRLIEAGGILAGQAAAAGESGPVALQKYTPPSTVFRFGTAPDKPVLIHSTRPEYTPQARAAGLEGTVILLVSVQSSGTVGPDIKVIRSLGQGLDEKAIECVQEWKFSPPRLDCRPQPTRVQIQVNFRPR